MAGSRWWQFWKKGGRRIFPQQTMKTTDFQFALRLLEAEGQGISISREARLAKLVGGVPFG